VAAEGSVALRQCLYDKSYKYLGLVISASCKKRFLHKPSKGVEIVKWQRKRCTRQFALIVERNVKFPSSRTQADQYTAESVGPRGETREEGSKSNLSIYRNFLSFFLYSVNDLG